MLDRTDKRANAYMGKRGTHAYVAPYQCQYSVGKLLPLNDERDKEKQRTKSCNLDKTLEPLVD